MAYPKGLSVRNSAGKIGPGLDIRGHGGYVIAPPSLHASGGTYEFDGMFSPNEVELADAPEWLLNLIAEREQLTPTSQGHPDSGNAFPEGKRNAGLTSLAGSMRRRGMGQIAIEAALIVENEGRCNPPLPESEVKAIVTSVQRYKPAGQYVARDNYDTLVASELKIDRLSDIAPKRVDWLWPTRLPKGKLSLIVGDPGLGKSYMTLDLAARVSVGGKWPTGEEIESGNVLIITAEDGAADTVRPRADQLGADVSKIFIIGVSVREGEKDLGACLRMAKGVAEGRRRTGESAV